MLGSSGSVDYEDMRELLRIRLCPPQDGGRQFQLTSYEDGRDKWTAAQYGRLCSLLSVYRLIDVLGQLSDVGVPAPCVERIAPTRPLESLPVCG